jgi:hypothetical protein
MKCLAQVAGCLGFVVSHTKWIQPHDLSVATFLTRHATTLRDIDTGQ